MALAHTGTGPVVVDAHDGYDGLFDGVVGFRAEGRAGCPGHGPDAVHGSNAIICPVADSVREGQTVGIPDSPPGAADFVERVNQLLHESGQHGCGLLTSNVVIGPDIYAGTGIGIVVPAHDAEVVRLGHVGVAGAVREHIQPEIAYPTVT